MAIAVAERVWRASTPATIEGDLSELWRDIGAKGKVARAVMSNLVLVRAAHVERRAGVSIDSVVAQHPSRVLIIDHDSSPMAGCEITAARVGVVTFGPPEARYGVEEIAVRSSCTDESLPSLVRRLVRGELPISVWLAEDVSRVPVLGSIVVMGRQLIFDSRQWENVKSGVLAVEKWGYLDLVDVNWRRVGSMRRALVVAADSSPSNAEAWSPQTIRITHRFEDRAAAWLLAGWLSSSLQWAEDAMPQVEQRADSATPLTVEIGEGEDSLVIRADGPQIVVQHGSRPPSLIGVPLEGDADTIAAELHALSHDGRLHDTLKALQRYFRAA